MALKKTKQKNTSDLLFGIFLINTRADAALPQFRCFDCLLAELQRKCHLSAKVCSAWDLVIFIGNASYDYIVLIKSHKTMNALFSGDRFVISSSEYK